MIAVSDTGPLLYLSLIDCTELLPWIFEQVLIPPAVGDELSDPSTPVEAAALIQNRSSWLRICDVPSIDPSLHRLGRGEQQAKHFATHVANITTSGTIGVLYEAAVDDLIPFTAADFDKAVERLLATNFRHTARLLEAVLEMSRKLRERQGGSRLRPLTT